MFIYIAKNSHNYSHKKVECRLVLISISATNICLSNNCINIINHWALFHLYFITNMISIVFTVLRLNPVTTLYNYFHSQVLLRSNSTKVGSNSRFPPCSPSLSSLRSVLFTC